jgi:hypothetical protein
MISEELDVSKLGTVRGMVTSVADPLNLCRVRVRIPIIHGVLGSVNFRPDNELPWAYPSLVPNTAFVPYVGDFVWIIFENNNASMPVYLGVVKGKTPPNPQIPVKFGLTRQGSITPSDYNAPYDGVKKGTLFESIGGFRIEYDDGDESNSFNGKITAGKGNTEATVGTGYIKASVGNNKITLDKDNISISLGNGNIEFGKDSINLKMGNSSIELKDDKILLKNGASSIDLSSALLKLVSPMIHENP